MGGTCAALTFLHLILDPGGGDGALAREVLGRARAAAAAARSEEFESPARAEPT